MLSPKEMPAYKGWLSAIKAKPIAAAQPDLNKDELITFLTLSMIIFLY